MNILVINGPNLNLLGTREPEIYGHETLEELMIWLENCSEAIDHEFKFYQSNHEGKIIDILHDERHWAQGIIINAGAYTHYSYAIRDAIEAISIPTVEVHITDTSKREQFRKKSVLTSVCIGTVIGLGKNSYLEGLKKILKLN
tara:strand:- start:2588 stop:3016 length:429 start_codon:yes stop_codon:yes gene_type:complete